MSHVAGRWRTKLFRVSIRDVALCSPVPKSQISTAEASKVESIATIASNM